MHGHSPGAAFFLAILSAASHCRGLAFFVGSFAKTLSVARAPSGASERLLESASGEGRY
jgi:hypothetical protein